MSEQAYRALQEVRKTLRQSKYKKPTRKQPSEATMSKWLFDGVAKATDGCLVEPDGTCPHGHVSWIEYLFF
jgi:hypothetical protein